MAINKTFIGNLALSKIGARDTISSLTEDSKAAREVNLWFTQSLTTSLEFSNWSFARKRRDLALDEEAAPEREWLFRYLVPADCILARYLENPYFIYRDDLYRDPVLQQDAVPYELEVSPDGNRNTLLTDLEDACLVYTFYHERFALMPSTFIQGLAEILGSNIAFGVTGKRGMEAEMFQKGTNSLLLAAAQDANQPIQRAPRDADWIEAR